ncbi:hypothetical protein L3476_05185 [Paenibacillus thiaminolyticus]|uniref:hypothetical protein n=1 Tax=Paenibacillus thiaminolyticus TaxID=49283 RepID=UPI002350BDB8|nr:hypothetical protein [Paenibacillus thiaminolyticus]MDG0875581.1 hypothetical protein [Paenibacillus thiaminolyticus]WCR28152.1 hypothetical protein L3476_05185 [Paenibacillus thiaminolyticus]
MRKVLLTLTALTLFAVPVLSASAQPRTIQNEAVPVFSTMDRLDIVEDEIPDEGEYKGSFYYEPSFGNEIRYHLWDKDGVGMTIKIYNENNKQVAIGKTTKTKNRITKSFRPGKYTGFYRYIIVPNDGGSGYQFEFSSRAF